MSCFDFSVPRAVAEIDTVALRTNFCALRAHAGGRRVIAVVKANAYGHGCALVVSALLAAGCDFFAVASMEEAVAVRMHAPRADILVLGCTPPRDAHVLAEMGITQTVFSSEYAVALDAALTRPLRVHIKLDGGMCRLGYNPDDRAGLAALANARNLAPTGAFTHFPCADTDPLSTRAALAHFQRSVTALGRPLLRHAAASAALLALPESHLDAVRPGLALYGIAPVESALSLRPALALRAPVVQIRAVPCGTAVGYGGDFVTDAPARIGVLPIGYADGFSRALRGLTVTLCHAEERFRVPLVGRICMDYTMVDLTGTPAAVGDTVTLFEDARVPARHANTIPYEILSALTARVVRRVKGATA